MKTLAIAIVLGLAVAEGAACVTYAVWVTTTSEPRGPIDDLLAPVVPVVLKRWACGRWATRFPHDHSQYCYHD